MSAEILLVIFVGVSALAFVIQSVSIWRAARSVRETAERLSRQAQELQQSFSQVLVKAQETAESLKPVGRVAEEVNSQVQVLSQVVRQRGEDLDLFLREMMRIGRDQASKVDYVVTDTVQKFEQTTEVIQKDVLAPVLELSSFFKGIKTGVEYLLSHRRAQKDKGQREEELFI